ETIGMALPGSAPIHARGARLKAQARLSGERIVAMIEEGLAPRSIMTPAAFANALTVGLAMSGSINMLRHLQAVATEGGVDIDVYRHLAGLDGKVPLLCAVKPNGPRHIEDLDAAGGAQALMKRLEPLL